MKLNKIYKIQPILLETAELYGYLFARNLKVAGNFCLWSRIEQNNTLACWGRCFVCLFDLILYVHSTIFQ